MLQNLVTELQQSRQASASKAPADDAGGLTPTICLAKSAHVMLNSNLWVEVGLVNGAMGTIKDTCYQTGGPPDLPIAVMVEFDNYTVVPLFTT